MKLNDFRFRPALLDALKGYRRDDFTADLGAGLTVACVTMPLAMAFGIALGLGSGGLLLLVLWPKPKQQPLHRKEIVQEGTPVVSPQRKRAAMRRQRRWQCPLPRQVTSPGRRACMPC